jgi:ATP-binding cassette subfamily B (MDR/TAP) protein 1
MDNCFPTGIIVVILFIICIDEKSFLLKSFLFAYSGEALVQRIRSKMFRTYLSQDIAWFDDPIHNTGSLCLQLSSEASAVQRVCLFLT